MTKLASDLTHLPGPDTECRDKGAEQNPLSEGFSCQRAERALAGAFLSKWRLCSMASVRVPKEQRASPAHLPCLPPSILAGWCWSMSLVQAGRYKQAPVVVIASSSSREPGAVGVGPRWCAGGLVWSGGSGLAREAANEQWSLWYLLHNKC